MDTVAAEERALLERLRVGLDAIPGVARYTMWGRAVEQIGVVTFNLVGFEPGLLAAILSAEHGIGVRHGCFCAHPLMIHLLRVPASTVTSIRHRLQNGEHPVMPGALRASIGVPTRVDDVDRLVAALAEIATKGPRWKYRASTASGDFAPDPETRAAPALAATS